jgi:hypothetical protein
MVKIEQFTEAVSFVLGEVEVASACRKSSVLADLSDLRKWVLVNAFSCEDAVNFFTEIAIAY